MGQPPLAIYANLLLGLHDFRCDYRNLVPGGRASAYLAHLADGASGLFSRRTKALPIVPWRFPRSHDESTQHLFLIREATMFPNLGVHARLLHRQTASGNGSGNSPQSNEVGDRSASAPDAAAAMLSSATTRTPSGRRRLRLLHICRRDVAPAQPADRKS